MDVTNDAKNSTKKWLQKLKDESWEAELLVSTISIFGAFQLFGLINWITNRFIDLLNPGQYRIGYFIVSFGLIAVSILVSMFVIHFFLRAYWVGLVGLNSVFPDYSVEDSAYSKIYTEKMLSILPKLKDSIHKVDELCSVIFSAAFTLLLLYAYMALFASIYLLIFNALSNYVQQGILLIPVYLIAFALLIQMLFGVVAVLKPYKEKRKLQIWYFNIVRFVSMIAYGPLYKSIMQVFMIFGSNFKKKKHMVYLVILFILSGMFVSIFKMFDTNIPYLINRTSYFDETKSYSNYYKSQNVENNFLLNPEIEADKIESNILKLYIPVFSYERKMRKNSCEPSNTRTLETPEQKIESKKELLRCYHKYNLVYINGEAIEVEFLRYNHPQTRQRGIISYINIANLEPGLNVLNVKKKFGEDNSTEWTIPFYYLPKD